MVTLISVVAFVAVFILFGCKNKTEVGIKEKAAVELYGVNATMLFAERDTAKLVFYSNKYY